MRIVNILSPAKNKSGESLNHYPFEVTFTTSTKFDPNRGNLEGGFRLSIETDTYKFRLGSSFTIHVMIKASTPFIIIVTILFG